MITIQETQLEWFRRSVCIVLRRLRFPVYRIGYKYLVLLICCFSVDSSLSLTKELYPFVADYCGASSWKAVEHAVRVVIQVAWEQGSREIWEEFFPGAVQPPTPKQFIATVAEFIKNTPPGWEG
ncbi:MAG: sporulation initiation factor Spo0A C-terminal domain-containing protein [Oscillospiraceae bacterium]|nr:sporulation initiation factor Spo0A C-terminal domain-containing protein [Oscillospiraceae bacterium]